MGLTILDTGILIGFINPNDSHHTAIAEALRAAIERGDQFVLPTSAYAELLVLPSQRGPRGIAAVDAGLERLAVRVHPVDHDVARSAALIRTTHRSVKLPDSLVIATAIAVDADLLLTTDRHWPSRTELGLRADVIHL